MDNTLLGYETTKIRSEMLDHLQIRPSFADTYMDFVIFGTRGTSLLEE